MGVMATLPLDDKQKDIIEKLRHGAEEDRAREEAKKIGLPYANLWIAPLNVEDIITIPEEISRKSGIVVIKKISKKLSVGVRSAENPATNKIIEDLKQKGYELRLFFISQRSMEKAWRRYKDYIPPAPSLKEILTI